MVSLQTAQLATFESTITLRKMKESHSGLPPICVRGAYGGGNLGDDALMFACGSILAGVLDARKVYYVCRRADYIRRIVKAGNVVTLAEVPQGLVLVYGGGTQFASFPLTRSDSLASRFRRVTGVLASPTKIAPWIRSHLSQQQLGPEFLCEAGLGIGLGPFVSGSAAERRTRELVRRMRFLSVRDRASLALCREWGASQAFRGSDLCFLPGLWEIDADHRTGPGRIGVVVRDWPHTHEGAAYAQPLLRAVDTLRRTGYSARFISFCRRTDAGWLSLLRKVGEPVMVWDPGNEDLASFIGALSRFDCIVTARYHGAVFASILLRPVVCIEVEPKLSLVSELLGECGQLWKQPFDPHQCVQLVESAVAQRDETKAGLQRIVGEQAWLAQRMVERFYDFLHQLI